MSQSLKSCPPINPISEESQRSLLNFSEAKRIIFRRKWLVVGITGLVLSVSGMMAAKTKPDYQSSMQLLVSSSLYQDSRDNPNKGEPNFTDSNLRIDYTAQLQVMTSGRLLHRAIEVLKKDYPDLTVEYLRGKPGAKNHLVILQLQEGIGSNKVPSQVFSISFTDKDPVKTQRVLEALQQVYLSNNLDEQKQRLTKGLTFINEQLPEAKAQVMKSENALEQFRRQYQLIDPDSQGKKLLDSIANTQEERRKIRAEFQQIQAQMRSSQQKLARSPQEALSASRLSQSSRYQTLLNEIQKVDLLLAEKKVIYQDNNPEIQILRQQRQEQMNLLLIEMERVLQPLEIPQVASLNQGQFGSIDLKLTEQIFENQTQSSGLSARDRILADQEQQLTQALKQYPQILSQYNRLKPEADLNRKSLENLLQSQQSLALKIAQGGFDWQVVEYPQLGTTEGTGMSMRLVMGLVLGTILGSIAALIAEQLDPVIYGVEALNQASNLPLLGILHLEKSSLKSRLQHLEITIPSYLHHLLLPTARRSFNRIYRHFQQPVDSDVKDRAKSVAIAAGTVDEAGLLIALGLALSAAAENQRVLLIDADGLFCPLNQVLHLSNNCGLVNVLEEPKFQISQAVQSWQPNIDVLTTGESINHLGSLLSTTQMMALMLEVEQKYDLILVHTAPILEAKSISWLAKCCRLILVTKFGTTRRPDLSETLEIIEEIPTIGVISHNFPLDILQQKLLSASILSAHPSRLSSQY